MAELNTSGSRRPGKGRGVKKGKKLSTRVDLTPMVDLGFLLITFFIFTTELTTPTTLRLILPKDVDPTDQQPEPESAVITLLPGKNNIIYYYEGKDPTQLKTSDYRSIRDVILTKKRHTDPKWFEVVLKPNKDATYKNAVDLLDEMKIDAIPHYALVDITPTEDRIVRATGHADGTP